MKDSISALELRYVLQELQAYLPARINQVYGKDDAFWFVLHSKTQGNTILYVELPKIFARLEKKPAAPRLPRQFTMILRKHLSGAWIEAIEQIGFERVIKFVCKGKQNVNVFAELFGMGNFVVCDEEDKIIQAYHMKTWKDRTIKRNMPYALPPPLPDPYTLTKEQLISLLTKDSIVKVLATRFGFGGPCAEELCAIAKIEKNTVANTVDAEKVLASIKELINRPVKPMIYGEEVFPFTMLTKKNGKEATSFLEALSGTVHFEPEVEVIKPTKYETIIKAQTKQKDKCIEESTKAKACGEALYSHYTYVQHVLDLIKESHYNWKDIKAQLKQDKRVIAINEHEGTMTLELP